MSGINAVNNSPSFGMALKIDPSASSIIKKQAVGLGKKGKDKFLAEIGNVHNRQLNNPVDIILRKSNRRNALVAEIVDSQAGRELGPVDNVVISQPFFFKNGSSKFLNRAEKRAERLNELNNQVEKLLKEIPEAKPEDFGKAIKGQSAEDLAGEV